LLARPIWSLELNLLTRFTAVNLFLSAIILRPAILEAAPKPANVLVIVNDASPLSRSIGEYYVRQRAIPPHNLCTITAPDRESITRDEYNRLVAGPVGICLRSKGLVESVLYLVVTQGVPLRVRGVVSRNGDNASVDSELTLLYGKLHGADYPLNGAIANPFYRQLNAEFRHPQFPIYLVTRLAAYDLAGVKAMIERSLAARNVGTFVLDLQSGEDDSGDAWLRNAAILLPYDRVAVDETVNVLYGQKRVIGYASWGSNDKHRKQRHLGFEWLPGAIATEYVSTNGRTFTRPPDTWNIGPWSDKSSYFANAPQTLTADFINDGATGASGHVDEPYLTYTPRPDYVLPSYYSGRNLAESFYAGIPGLSWQNIIVGDPLCSLGPPK
jgi:uncharacterized protein (TIGR03790 family)